MAKRERIPVNPAPTGLNAAFAGLSLGGLPPGPPPPAAVAKPEQKPKKGRVVLRRETARRGGKCVSVIDDFPTHFRLSEIEEIARALRGACGCGGTVKDRKIEIQGEQIAKIRELLESDGFQVAGVR
jgi:translation initiation factor 1